ncbi:MAG: hypothetical protein MZW92_17755 [Comamonadaceae bacterium]|nr:hypothetical protein [Comamonadaceae bacterium]
MPAMELKNTADYVLRKRLLAVPGVAEVLPIGGDLQQFQVTVQAGAPGRLRPHPRRGGDGACGDGNQQRLGRLLRRRAARST